MAPVALGEPKTLPLVRIGRGAKYLAGWAGAVEPDGVSMGVEGRQAVEETLSFVTIAKQRGNKRNLSSMMGRDFRNGACQRRMRRNLDDLAKAVIEGLPKCLRERNRCTEISNPVLGIERFAFSKAAVNGRVERDCCGLGRQFSNRVLEVTEERIHVEAVRSEVHLKKAGELMLSLGVLDESFDGLSIPRDQNGGG